MDLSLNYTNESSDIKSQNSQGQINLSLGYDGKPYDLHVIADNKITVKIGNAEGYIQDIVIDTSNEDDDDKYSGRFSIQLSDPNIQNLPPDIYYLEVWINTKDAQGNQQQLIFPSSSVLPFTLTSNIVNGSNSMPMITYENIQKDWASFKDFVLQHYAEIENDFAEMDDATNTLTNKVDNGISGYTQFVSSAGQNLDSLANSGSAKLNDAVTNANSNVANIDEMVQSAKAAIGEAKDGVYSVVDGDVNSAEADITNVTNSANTNTTNTVNSAEMTINRAANGVTEAVDTTVNSAVTRVDSAADGIKGQVGSIVSSGKNDMGNVASNYNNMVYSTASVMFRTAGSFSNEIDSAVNNVHLTVNSADNNMSNFANDIDSRTSSADTHIDRDVSNADNHADSTMNSVDAHADSDVSSADSHMDSTMSSADNHMSNFANDINSRTSSADAHIDTDVSNADSHISSHVSSADDHIDNHTNSADNHIDSDVSSADNHVDSDVNSAESQVSNVVSSADSNLTSHVNSGDGYITSKANSVADHTDNDVKNIDSHMNSLFNVDDSKTSSAVSHVDSDATSVTNMATSYSAGMNSQAISAYNSLNASGVSAYDTISNSAQSAYNSIKVSASSAYANIGGSDVSASSAISSETQSGLDRISALKDSANASLENDINDAGTEIENVVTNNVTRNVRGSVSDMVSSVGADVNDMNGEISAINSTAETHVEASSAHTSLDSRVTSVATANSTLANAIGSNAGSQISSIASQVADFNDHTGSSLAQDISNTNASVNSLSGSTNGAIVNGINQANANTNIKASYLQDLITGLHTFNYNQSKTDTDLNDYHTGGIYYINDFDSGTKNTPNNWNDAVLVVYDLGSTNVQQFYMHFNGDIYTRNYTDGSWGKWERIATNDDINNLQNQINSLFPSLANSARNDANNYADQVATSAINQANVNMESNSGSLSARNDDLQNQINQNKSNTENYYDFKAGQLYSATDLDLFNDGGVFHIDETNTKHLPTPGSTNEGFLIVYANNPWTNWQQFYINYDGGLYTRNRTGGYKSKWGNWTSIVTGIDLDAIRELINNNNNNLQNQINSRPNWDDENWTRNTVVPNAATSVLNQANSNMEVNRSNLQNQITWLHSFNNARADTDLNDYHTGGVYYIDDFDSGTKNTPNNWNDALLIVYDLGSTNVQQFYIHFNGDIYTRNYTDGGWGNWQCFATTDEIASLQRQITDKQNQINNRPTWEDENWTRQHTIPETIHSQFSSEFNNAFRNTGHSLITNGDLNTIRDGGIYYVDGSCANAPIGNHSYLIVYSDDWYTNWNQILIGFDGSIFARNKTGGWDANWKPWQKISTSDDINNLQNQVNDAYGRINELDQENSELRDRVRSLTERIDNFDAEVNALQNEVHG